MDKLEKAIRLKVPDSMFARDLVNLEVEQDPSMEEIAKMVNKPLLTPAELAKKEIVFQGCKQIELLHQLRDIRTALSADPARNVVMITSLGTGYGTSFFARNLAAMTAFDSSRTSLLIDCNIEKPSINKVFGLEDCAGVLDYVLDEEFSMEEIIHDVGIKRFRCIPSGKHRGEHQDYFTLPRFRSLIINLKQRYSDRNIFIDAPPIFTSSDTRILLDVCDQVVVVVPYGKVDQRGLNSVGKVIPKEKYSGVVYNGFIR